MSRQFQESSHFSHAELDAFLSGEQVDMQTLKAALKQHCQYARQGHGTASLVAKQQQETLSALQLDEFTRERRVNDA